jgi:hypothetical protein
LVLTGNCSLIGAEDFVGLGDRELGDVYGGASSILDCDRWPMFAVTYRGVRKYAIFFFATQIPVVFRPSPVFLTIC